MFPPQTAEHFDSPSTTTLWIFMKRCINKLDIIKRCKSAGSFDNFLHGLRKPSDPPENYMVWIAKTR